MSKYILIAIGIVLGFGGMLYATKFAAPPAAPDLAGKSVAILLADGFHDRETLTPKEFFENGGAIVTILGPEVGAVAAYNSDLTIEVALSVSDANPADFDALVIPGGRAPRVLRENEAALDFVRAFMESGKVVGAICHGPQVLAASGALAGRTVTGYSGIAGEVKDAGGEFVDGILIFPFTARDGNLITARLPHDLRPFCRRLGEALASQS